MKSKPQTAIKTDLQTFTLGVSHFLPLCAGERHNFVVRAVYQVKLRPNTGSACNRVFELGSSCLLPFGRHCEGFVHA